MRFCSGLDVLLWRLSALLKKACGAFGAFFFCFCGVFQMLLWRCNVFEVFLKRSSNIVGASVGRFYGIIDAL